MENLDIVKFDIEWDKAVNLEAEVYEQGVTVGKEAAIESGFFEEGIKSGFSKGMSVGLELGYNAAVARHFIKISSTSASSSLRLRRHCESIINKVESIPRINDPNVDFEGIVRDVRAMTRQICNREDAHLLPFTPPTSTGSSDSLKQTKDW